MNTHAGFPSFDVEFEELNQFILALVDDYNMGRLNSWDELDERVKTFYTPERMDDIEAKAAGWKKMASYSDGITLAHVTCVFLGMFMLPEFRALNADQQQIAKWIALFHDIDKFHISGKKDTMHAFRSGVIAANILPKIGFQASGQYEGLIHSWSEFTINAFTIENENSSQKPDNSKLPEILSGIEKLFEENTPACLITKTALLHISLNVDKNYPTPSPLTENETRQFINLDLLPLLKVMMLSDTEGWSLFEPEARYQRKRDALEAFDRVENLISQAVYKGAIMDKEFWISIAKNEYKIPDGPSLGEITKTLFGYLGSTDPELRDDIAYTVYANFLKCEMYSKEEVRAHVDVLLSNLEEEIGETESDSVFLRAFSILFLAEIVHNDNKKPLLDEDVVRSILAKGLWYLDAEKDPRGHVPVKGWAHALAHTADLMLVLGRNRQTMKEDLEKILQGISNKLVHSTNWIYIHGEDERLANAVMAVFARDLVSEDFLKEWLKSFLEPEKSWNGAYMDEDQAKAFHNVRNFLRSVFIAVHSSEELPRKRELGSVIFEAVENLKPY